MAYPGQLTLSLATELLFLILTSWAPIWIYSCGMTDYVQEREAFMQETKGVYRCGHVTCKYGWYLIAYVTLYTLIIVYFTEETPADDLVTWIFVIYGLLVASQMITICDRRFDSDRYYKLYKLSGDRWAKKRKPEFKRHRFSLVGRAKDYIGERKRILESRKRNLQRQPPTEETRRQIRRIETQIDELDNRMENEDDWSSDEDNFETARDFKF